MYLMTGALGIRARFKKFRQVSGEGTYLGVAEGSLREISKAAQRITTKDQDKIVHYTGYPS